MWPKANQFTQSTYTHGSEMNLSTFAISIYATTCYICYMLQSLTDWCMWLINDEWVSRISIIKQKWVFPHQQSNNAIYLQMIITLS